MGTNAPDTTYYYGGMRVSLSTDGRLWRTLPASLPGRLKTLAVSPINTNVIYAATSEGLYVTDNNGEQWNEVTMPAEVTAVAMDTGQADLAYVATSEPAIYRITDQGVSRQRVAAEELMAREIRRLVVNPSDSEVVLAVTDAGVFHSTTAGEQWARVDGLPGGVSALTADAQAQDVFYVGTSDTGLYRSRDGGQTWEPANAGLDVVPGASLAVSALRVDREQPGRLYAATAYVLGHTRRVLSPDGVYVSNNGGTDWIRIATFDTDAPVVTAVVPAAEGGRVVTAEGVKTYTFDVGEAVARLNSPDVDERLPLEFALLGPRITLIRIAATIVMPPVLGIAAEYLFGGQVERIREALPS